jgi:hypothetical protein
MSLFDNTTTQKKLLISKRFSVFGVIVVGLLIFRISFEPSSFRDYFPYLDYFSEIRSYGVWSGGLDPASNFVFYLIGLFTSDRELAVLILYGYILFLFFLASWYLITVHRINWLNYWIFFTLFGPLLALITIRATPAYLAIFLSFFALQRGRVVVALVFSLLGAAFHFSGLLLVPVVIAAAVLGPRLEQSAGSRRVFWLVFTGMWSVGAVMAFFGVGSALAGFELGELLVRYSSYLSETESGAGVFHRIYFLAALALSFLSLYLADDVNWRARLFIGFAAIQYSLIAWSPVFAFRQSIFWVAPAILIFPFEAVLRWRSLRVLVAFLFLFVLFYSAIGIFEDDFVGRL